MGPPPLWVGLAPRERSFCLAWATASRDPHRPLLRMSVKMINLLRQVIFGSLTHNRKVCKILNLTRVPLFLQRTADTSASDKNQNRKQCMQLEERATATASLIVSEPRVAAYRKSHPGACQRLLRFRCRGAFVWPTHK
jgi:hypothetical protein